MKISGNGYCEVSMKRCEHCFIDREERSDGLVQEFLKCEKTSKRIRRDTVCPNDSFQKK